LKIYLASSWRNPHQPRLVELLRRVGHEVYDFRNPPDKSGFGWEQTGQVRRGPDGKAVVNAREYRDTLAHPIARAGYEADRGGIEWADACVFVAPAGRSASWELGYATALGKLVVVHLAEEMEPELMFFESMIVGSDAEMIAALGGVVLEDPAMPPPDVVEAMAKGCTSGCGITCGDRPCAGCMQGAPCDSTECHCGETDDNDEPDDDWDPNACPGCGGNCHVACR